MNVSQILFSLERERQLLQDFRSLCEQQLALLNVEDISSVSSLLDQRADLMLEMAAIEATLGTWIDQVKANPVISPETMGELVSVNEEIVVLAKMVVDIDDETHWTLDFIKTRCTNGYSRSVGRTSNASLEYLR